MLSRCSAFDASRTDGLLAVSTDGDLWQRIPDPQADIDRWSFYGPIHRVSPTQLPEKLRPALARLKLLSQPSVAAAQHAGT